jgi:hypothetical protein
MGLAARGESTIDLLYFHHGLLDLHFYQAFYYYCGGGSENIYCVAIGRIGFRQPAC